MADQILDKQVGGFAAFKRRWTRSLPTFEFGPPDETGHIAMTLSRMNPGDQGHVLEVCANCKARPQLLEMGFTSDTAIEMVRIAPLGDPITVRIRGYELSLRRQEADCIRVRRCPPEITDPWHNE